MMIGSQREQYQARLTAEAQHRRRKAGPEGQGRDLRGANRKADKRRVDAVTSPTGSRGCSRSRADVQWGRNRHPRGPRCGATGTQSRSPRPQSGRTVPASTRKAAERGRKSDAAPAKQPNAPPSRRGRRQPSTPRKAPTWTKAVAAPAKRPSTLRSKRYTPPNTRCTKRPKWCRPPSSAARAPDV